MNWKKWPAEKPEAAGRYYVRTPHYDGRYEPGAWIFYRYIGITTLDYTPEGGWNTSRTSRGEINAEHALTYREDDRMEWAPVEITEEDRHERAE